MADEKVKGTASYFPAIEKKYGKPIAEWQAIIHSRLPARHMELVTFLKDEHGMGHGHANALVGATLAEGETVGARCKFRWRDQFTSASTRHRQAIPRPEAGDRRRRDHALLLVLWAQGLLDEDHPGGVISQRSRMRGWTASSRRRMEVGMALMSERFNEGGAEIYLPEGR
jgi:hypothetical protein